MAILLSLLVAVFAALLTWTLCTRSAIPLGLAGTVTGIAARDEHPGHDNAWFVEVAGVRISSTRPSPSASPRAIRSARTGGTGT